MSLDIEFRNLPKGCLVNSEGRAARFLNSTFVCGMQIGEKRCGDGGECKSCFTLLFDLKYYLHLMKWLNSWGIELKCELN